MARRWERKRFIRGYDSTREGDEVVSHFNIIYSTIIVSMERRGYMSFFREGNVTLDFQVNIQTYLVGCFMVLLLLLHSPSSFIILWFTLI